MKSKEISRANALDKEETSQDHGTQSDLCVVFGWKDPSKLVSLRGVGLEAPSHSCVHMLGDAVIGHSCQFPQLRCEMMYKLINWIIAI
jgi:hypothetical protein